MAVGRTKGNKFNTISGDRILLLSFLFLVLLLSFLLLLSLLLLMLLLGLTMCLLPLMLPLWFGIACQIDVGAADTTAAATVAAGQTESFFDLRSIQTVVSALESPFGASAQSASQRSA